MWVSALDERIRASIPVVSVGSFEAYVGRRNCICETLPGGLPLAEEWEILGLIAPRPLLIINALHDQPAFGYDAMTRTARPLKEIYHHLNASQDFEARILDMTHGFHPPVLEAMLGWFKHHLCDASSSSPHPLPDWTPLPEEMLLCFPEGERPASSSYPDNRCTLSQLQHSSAPTSATGNLQTLARIIGWQGEVSTPKWIHHKSYSSGMETGAFLSPRGTAIPVTLSQSWDENISKVHILLSPEGKQSQFVREQWRQLATDAAMVINMDLPATGELAWEQEPLVANTRLHDAARACLWLGYTLVGEWAETISALCMLIKQKTPKATLTMIADQEAAFAALLARTLQPLPLLRITEHDTPASLQDEETMQWKSRSLAWIVPGFLQWGDLDNLRRR